MIIRGPILVSIPRCASHALHAATSGWWEPWNHQTATQIVKAIPALVRYLGLVACVRDPRDRLVSWWHFCRGQRPDIYGESFREWIERGAPHHWRIADDSTTEAPLSCCTWTHDDEGRQIVPVILRFERLQEDADDEGIRVPSQRINASEHPPWQDLWTPDLLRLAEPIIGRDLDTWGYR